MKSLTNKIINQLLEGKRLEEIDIELRNRLAETEEGRDLLEIQSLIQTLDQASSESETLSDDAMMSSWEAIESHAQDSLAEEANNRGLWQFIKRVTDRAVVAILPTPSYKDIDAVLGEVHGTKKPIYIPWNPIFATLLVILVVMVLGLVTGKEESSNSKKSEQKKFAFQTDGQLQHFQDHTVKTYPDKTAQFKLGRHANGMLNEATAMKLLANNEIKLQEGSIWLDIEPGGQGFQVQTDFGDVFVTGTSFGVTILENEARVDVAHGKVIFRKDGVGGAVTAGNAMSIDDQKILTSESRKDGDAKSYWVMIAERKRKGIEAVLTINKTVYKQNEPIIVTFEKGTGDDMDWIGVHKVGHQPGRESSQMWFYTDGTNLEKHNMKEEPRIHSTEYTNNGVKNASAKFKSGIIEFIPKKPLEKGRYKIQFFYANKFNPLTENVYFTIE